MPNLRVGPEIFGLYGTSYHATTGRTEQPTSFFRTLNLVFSTVVVFNQHIYVCVRRSSGLYATRPSDTRSRASSDSVCPGQKRTVRTKDRGFLCEAHVVDQELVCAVYCAMWSVFICGGGEIGHTQPSPTTLC